MIAELCLILFGPKPHLNLTNECMAFVPFYKNSGELTLIASDDQSLVPQLLPPEESTGGVSGGNSGKKTDK